MHKKWINAIVAVGKRHKWATPLLVALLTVLFGIAAVAEWCGRLWHQTARRVMAFALAVCMMFTLLPVNTLAAEGDIPTGSSSLTCHTEHDADCGYAETIENGGCTHEHNENCGYTEGTEASPCNYIPEEDEANTSNDDVHEHDEDCGYAEAISGTDCTHEHDADCGYTETVTVTSPCTHQCELCNIPGGRNGRTGGAVCLHRALH